MKAALASGERRSRINRVASGVFVPLAEWKRAIRNAEPDAQRFLNAAKMKASEIDRSSGFAQVQQLVSVLDRVAGIQDPTELDGIQSLMRNWALPLLLFANVPAISGLRAPFSGGHRRLVLEGSDVASNPLTGFRNVDRHLLTVRDRLRSFPGLNQDDLANMMTVLGGFGSIAAFALRDAIFAANTSEREFQAKAIALLRMRPEIGGDLHSHPEAAGGITDLTFRDVPIELKVENDHVLYPKDFSRYFDQVTAYALGLGKRIALLSVLESCVKSSPVGNIEDDIDVFPHSVGSSSIAIVVVTVRGGLPKPSSYSKH